MTYINLGPHRVISCFLGLVLVCGVAQAAPAHVQCDVTRCVSGDQTHDMCHDIDYWDFSSDDNWQISYVDYGGNHRYFAAPPMITQKDNGLYVEISDYSDIAAFIPEICKGSGATIQCVADPKTPGSVNVKDGPFKDKTTKYTTKCFSVSP